MWDADTARARRELISEVKKLGFPEELGVVIARNLGSEKTMRRMAGYLRAAKPKTAEEMVDEMLAIMDDRSRWIEKKNAEYYNSKYNEMLYYGLGTEEDEE